MERASALFFVVQLFTSCHQIAAQVCGGTYTNSTGVIMSRNHPSNYNKYDYCLWIIRMPSSYSGISLNFTAFHTEPDFDILEVRNGDTYYSPLVNRYNGSTIPDTVSITGNNMWVQFTSGSSTTHSGFRAEWSPRSTVCGGTNMTSSGFITSPNYPSNYNNNDNCTWIIRMPPSHAGISLHFTAFSTKLNYDILEVRNGDTDTSPLVNRYSGFGIPANVSTTGYNMWIQFTSHGSPTYSGFRVEWSPRSEVCDGTYWTQTGVITSPNHPLDYNNNDYCVYIIRMPSSYSGISLRFTAFYTELNRDIVEVRIGVDEYGSLIGRYSGSKTPSTITISGNSMWIKFTSDNSVTRSGFRAEWTPSKTVNDYGSANISLHIYLPGALMLSIVTIGSIIIYCKSRRRDDTPRNEDNIACREDGNDSSDSHPASTPLGHSELEIYMISSDVRSTNQNSGRNTCAICMDNDVDAVYVPCGHGLCLTCAVRHHRVNGTCHQCRAHVADILRVYL